MRFETGVVQHQTKKRRLSVDVLASIHLSVRQCTSFNIPLLTGSSLSDIIFTQKHFSSVIQYGTACVEFYYLFNATILASIDPNNFLPSWSNDIRIKSSGKRWHLCIAGHCDIFFGPESFLAYTVHLRFQQDAN
ncbi:hypothetical protein Tcan_01596, partial [Toxocara canis]